MYTYVYRYVSMWICNVYYRYMLHMPILHIYTKTHTYPLKALLLKLERMESLMHLAKMPILTQQVWDGDHILNSTS